MPSDGGELLPIAFFKHQQNICIWYADYHYCLVLANFTTLTVYLSSIGVK